MRWKTILESAGLDVKYSLRTLARTRTFTAIACLSLAICKDGRSQISADGIVQMNVSPTLATPGRSVVEVDTMVRVRGGETVVIAGLVREATEVVAAGGVPGILGVKNRRTSRTELVLLLTPTVVNAGSLPVAGAQ